MEAYGYSVSIVAERKDIVIVCHLQELVAFVDIVYVNCGVARCYRLLCSKPIVSIGEVVGFAVLGDALELSAGLPRHSHTVTIIYGITYFIVSNCLTVVVSQQVSPTKCISVGLPRALAEQSLYIHSHTSNRNVLAKETDIIIFKIIYFVTRT